jgi:hypothetical protein
MSVAIGMTRQILSLVGTDGEEMTRMLRQEVSGDDDAQYVTVRRWTEGNYEWVAAAAPFDDLEDLNARMAQVEGFKGLSLTRERGLIRDRYVLDGEIAPLMASEEGPIDLLLDPSGMLQFQMVVGLPGDVLRTNGAFVDESRMLWTMGSYEPLRVHAVSQAWNWSRIAVLAAGIVLAACGLVLIAVLTVALRGGKREERGDDTLKQGIRALQEGRRGEARQLLVQVLREDAGNEQAWLWMSGTVKTNKQRQICLEKVLEINPDNDHALKGLRQLRAASEPGSSI